MLKERFTEESEITNLAWTTESLVNTITKMKFLKRKQTDQGDGLVRSLQTASNIPGCGHKCKSGLRRKKCGHITRVNSQKP